MTTGTEGEGGGFGGAADLLGGAMPQGDAGTGGDGGDSGEGGGGEGGVEAALGADPDWWGTLSADAEGESASNRDWVKSRGAKTLDDLVRGFRDTQRALHDKNSGMVKVPGEGASAEEVSAYRTAIGVPESAEGYELPEVKDADGNVVPLHEGLLGKLLPKALEHGVPAAAMNGLIADFVALQLDEAAQFDADIQNAAKAWVTKQGAEEPAARAAINQAGRALGLNSQEVIAIRNALAAVNGTEAGVAKTLDMFTKLGQGMAEDTIITGGTGRFGVTGREAQGELDQMKTRAGQDKEFGRKVMTEGTPENARWKRLQAQAAEWQRQQDAA